MIMARDGIKGRFEIQKEILSIIVLEKPNDTPVCTDFRFINIPKSLTAIENC